MLLELAELGRISSEVVHQATVDACTMSVDAGRDGFAAVGC